MNDYSKIIYKGLEANKEQMKTGTAKIELGTAFTKILETEGGEEKIRKILSISCRNIFI